MKKKILSFMLIFTLITILCPLTTQASSLDESLTTETLDSIRYNHIKDYAQYFLSQNDYYQELKESNLLYNFNNEVVAILYNLEPGYIIINVKDFSIPEFSLISNSYYSSSTNLKYYNGAFEYYEESKDNKLINMYDNNEYEIISLNKSTMYGNDSIIINSDFISTITSNSITPLSYNTKYLSSSLPNYSYNPNKICGANAAAMYLRYLDINKNSMIIPYYYEEEVTLITYLSNYIPPSSNPGQVYGGMNNYLSNQNVTLYFSLATTNMGDVARCITSNTPYIAGFVASSPLKAHWATGYGYAEYSTGVTYLIINDGHGQTGVFINIIESDFIIG